VSKAFTRETDGAAEDEELEQSAQQPRGIKNHITQAGYSRLKNELDHLWKVERPEVVKTVAWAASNGDRSENGDYIYGKKRLREIDRRIRFLTRRLDLAEVVRPGNRDADQVFFGATVTVCDEEGKERTVTIVGMDEVDPARGRVSWISPIAKALLKARLGDVVTFRSPAGVQELEVVDVCYAALEETGP
jgi:transcription elongation factor GreB